MRIPVIFLMSNLIGLASFSQVGIGTTSPSVELDIEVSSGATSIDLNNTAADGDLEINFQLDGTTTFSLGLDDTDDNLEITTGTLDSETPVLTITTDNKIGIMTNSPNANLEVDDGDVPAVNDVILKVTADNSNPYGIVVGNDTYSTTDYDGLTMYVGNGGTSYLEAKGTGAILSIGVNGTNGDDVMISSTEMVVNEGSYSSMDFRAEKDNNDHALFVDASADKIGINTSSPSEDVDIVGNVELNGALMGTVRVYDVDNTESDYTSGENTKVSVTLTAGTWLLFTGFQADGDDGTDWIYWRIRNTTDGTDVVSYQYTLTNENGNDGAEYLRPFTVQNIITVDGTETISLQFDADTYTVDVSNASMMAIKISD